MANLTPGTPSAKYDVTLVSSDPIFVELRGNVYLTVIGAKSRSLIDLPNYDQGNYRDIVDASTLGRAPMVIQKITDSGIVVDNDVLPISSDAIASITDTALSAPIPDQIAIMMMQDDNFTHEDPRNEVKARTRIQWWSDVGAAGNEVGACWNDRYIGSSGRIPQNNGAVPPAFTP